MEMEIMKNGKFGIRIVAFKLKDGSYVVGSTNINRKDGYEFERGYWKWSTVENKIRKYAKKYGLKKYNHAKHYSMIV